MNKDGLIDLEEFKISVEANKKKAEVENDNVGFLHILLDKIISHNHIQEEQLYRLHEDTEFTEEEFEKYKMEKVFLVSRLKSIPRSGRSGR